MKEFKKEMSGKLIKTLEQVPAQQVKPVKIYFQSLLRIIKEFREEIMWNISQSSCHLTSNLFLTSVDSDLRESYMMFDGTFDVFINPQDYKDIDKYTHRLKTYREVHILIYKYAIFLISTHKKSVKNTLKYQHPQTLLNPKIEKELSYFIWKGEIISCIENAYAINNANVLGLRTGEKLPLNKFVEKFCSQYGLEVKNVERRIKELRDRKEPLKFLIQLLKVGEINLESYS